MSNTNQGRNTAPIKLSVSRGYDILYNDGTLDYVFGNQIQEQPVFREDKESLFSRGIDIENKLVKGIDSNGLPVYSDNVNSYIFNSLGYRSPEFGTAKILYAGCSNTFGTGVPEETIWGTVLANKLNLPYANLSKQGASAQWIVKNIFAYFDEYGHPDVLCCLFPDPYRMSIASNEDLLTDSTHPAIRKEDLKRHSISSVFEVHLGMNLSPKKSPEYSKKPHKMTDVIPADAAVYASIQSVLMLDQYCRAAGIRFVWSTWDVGYVDFLQEMKALYPKKYSSLLDSDMYCWINNPDKEVGGEVYVGEEFRHNNRGNLPAKNCHADLLKKYGVNFYRGMDALDGVYNAHPGVHQHAHIADAFLKVLK